MGKPVIDKELCTGCGLCVDECPPKCLELVDNYAALVRPNDCDECGKCKEVCPSDAIELKG